MHSYNGILFSNEKEWITNIYNVTDEPENHYAGGKKKQDIQDYIPCDCVPTGKTNLWWKTSE